MIYSDPHKFIFLAVPKTGSRSVQGYLEKYGTRSKKGWDPNHDGYEKVMERIGPKRQDYFKFAFFRNPWSLLISVFWYNKNKHRLPLDKDSVRRWLETYKGGDPYLIYMFDKSGDYILDFAGKLENINEDMKNACEKINVPSPENISHIGSVNHAKRLHYTEYYTVPLKNKVKSIFSKSLEILKYDFDDGVR